jgi:hypothetical protein
MAIKLPSVDVSAIRSRSSRRNWSKLRMPDVDVRRMELPRFDTPHLEVSMPEMPHFDIPRPDLTHLDLPRVDMSQMDPRRMELPHIQIPRPELPAVNLGRLEDLHLEMPDLREAGRAMGGALEAAGDKIRDLTGHPRKRSRFGGPRGLAIGAIFLAVISSLVGAAALFFAHPVEGARRRAAVRERIDSQRERVAALAGRGRAPAVQPAGPRDPHGIPIESESNVGMFEDLRVSAVSSAEKRHRTTDSGGNDPWSDQSRPASKDRVSTPVERPSGRDGSFAETGATTPADMAGELARTKS